MRDDIRVLVLGTGINPGFVLDLPVPLLGDARRFVQERA